MRRIIAIIAVLGLVATLGGCVGSGSVADNARQSQAEKIGQILGLVGEGKLPLHDEMSVKPADPSKPMTNVSVTVRRAADPRIMMALLQLCDMSRYKDPATVADVLIAMVGAAKEVAIKGLDQLPWYWGFDALKGALNQRGYDVRTGDGGNVIIASNGTNAPQVGRDLNSGEVSGSDRDKEKSKVTNKTEAGSN